MKSVAVYCGSSFGGSELYKEAASQLGTLLASRGVRLIYGGASVGIMGAIADAVLAKGGEAVGILPALLENREISHKSLTELIIVDSMHERKHKMMEQADGFIVLPGGAGTLEEFFEVFTWSQIGLHQKPVAVFNVNQYYDPLVHMLEHMSEQGFMQPKFLEALIVSSSATELFNKMLNFEPPGLKTYN